MRRSKIIEAPVIKLPLADEEERAVYRYNPQISKVVFGTDNVAKENLSKYRPLLIKLSDVPKTIDGEFVLNKDGGYDITFDSFINSESKNPIPLEGKFAVAIVNNEDKIVANMNIVFAFSEVRAILDEYFLMPNTEGKMQIRLTGREEDYGDLKYVVYNGESAIAVKRAIHNQLNNGEAFEDSEFKGLKDAPNVLVVDKEGNYKAGEEGSATIGVHIMSEFAKINKVQLVNISVDANMNALGGEEDTVGITAEQLDAMEKFLIEKEGVSSGPRKR